MPRTSQKRGNRNKAMKYRAAVSKRRKDVDQILESLNPEQLSKIENAKPDIFLPGEGKNYCVLCDRHFVTAEDLATHLSGKQHKRQIKKIQFGGFTPQDAEAAAGRGAVDNGAKILRDENGELVKR